MSQPLTCFKAYDIRGKVPGDINPALAWALGLAVTENLRARRVVVGRDARLSGPELRDALASGLAHGRLLPRQRACAVSLYVRDHRLHHHAGLTCLHAAAAGRRRQPAAAQEKPEQDDLTVAPPKKTKIFPLSAPP